MRRLEIGLLYSRSGSYRLISEACRAGALRGIEEVNADASLGLTLVPLERDPGGEADAYAPLCAELLGGGARHVVGCVTSLSRKEVIPTLERLGGVLWYACPYEGFEASSQVVYAHACPNQHLVPLLRWAFPRWGRRAFLTGSNYIWGWEVNRVARDLTLEAGGEVLGERYLALGEADVSRMVEEIRATRPSFVLNNLVGVSSYAFLTAMAALGRADPDFGPDRCPVLSCNLSECELPALGEAAEGLVSVGPHFSKGAGGGSSFETATHAAVLTLAARLAPDPGALLRELLARGGGPLRIDPATHHATLPVLIAQVEGGAFRVRESWEAVAPDPYLARRDRFARPRAQARRGGAVRRLRIPDLGGARALVLHRPHSTVQALSRQLSVIGLSSEAHWPDLPASALGADFVFFDMDMGHDEQFPWAPGQAPMPMVALIGSEAPGRVEWALGMGADAQLLKPVGDSGVYSALLIARAAFEARRALAGEIEGLHARLAERRTVVRAVMLLAVRGDDEAAYAELRRLAMGWRVTIEEAAARVVAKGEGTHVRRRPS